MSDPIDPWAVRPEGRASEPWADAARPTEDLHTADPTAAYGHAPNPTLAYPTYESLAQQQAARRPPYGWPGPPQPMPQPHTAPARRSIALLVAAGIGLGFLVAALIGGAYLLVRPQDDSSAAPGPQDTQLPAQPFQSAPQSPDGRPSLAPGPFGAPAPGTTYGATVGNVTATDGGTLSVQGVLGDKTNVVHTTDQTKVLGVNRVKVSDLKVGDMVIVQGDKAADGSITARLIISTALGGGN